MYQYTIACHLVARPRLSTSSPSLSLSFPLLTIDSSEVERGERRQGSAALLPSWDSNGMSSGLSVESAGSAVENVQGTCSTIELNFEASDI